MGAGEFACGGDDEDFGPAGESETAHGGEAEGGGFTGAGASLGDEVFAGEDEGKLALVRHLVSSQWGFLRGRMTLLLARRSVLEEVKKRP